MWDVGECLCKVVALACAACVQCAASAAAIIGITAAGTLEQSNRARRMQGSDGSDVVHVHRGPAALWLMWCAGAGLLALFFVQARLPEL
jgi:uncharacterized membrane protein